ncbi:FHA domain-containing protein [Halocynthiibacter sp.]|uniref:FHA domain-containing protein n=1 Tax=Halocynthiibacter sp. TaxID=1979210 RepID=UPI003C55478B
MFNYKSPLSRILEKPSEKDEETSAAPDAETLARALSEQSPEEITDEFFEDSEELAGEETATDLNSEETPEVTENDAQERSDFMVSQSAFDEDLVDDENIFAEAADQTEVVEAAQEAPQQTAEVLSFAASSDVGAIQDETPAVTNDFADVLVDEAPEEPVVADAEAAVEIESEPTPEPASKPVQQVEEITPEVQQEASAENVAADPAPAAPAQRRRGRIKTTFLGLDPVDNRLNDLITSEPVKKTAVTTSFPVGWLVITRGPGRGTSLSLTEGLQQLGRNDDQALQLDFGDNGISRSNHAVIAYDAEERKCFLGHGGKANLVRLNGSPVLSTLPLTNGDMIRISETTMRYVSLCDENFDWRDET